MAPRDDTATMLVTVSNSSEENSLHQLAHLQQAPETKNKTRFSLLDLEHENYAAYAVAEMTKTLQAPSPRVRQRLQLAKQIWERHRKPQLATVLNEHQLIRFQHLYEVVGLTSFKVLYSLAFIASSSDAHQQAEYVDHLEVVAGHLAIGRASKEVRLASLRTLMECLSPIVALWQIRDAVLEGTLDFLLHRHMEWEFMEHHTEMNLILELRAFCLRHIEREQQRIARVIQTGDMAAVIISASAKLVEAGMKKSASVLSGKLETAGEQVKDWVKPEDYPLFVDRNAIVALAFSDAARRASEGARNGTVLAVNTVRDLSARGLSVVTDRVDGGRVTARLSPEGAEAVRAVGKIGMATIGAAAIVGEAMVETSRALVKKTGSVTADIVGHKYGASAGQVVTDAGETAENIVRAVGNVALFETHVMAKSVAKNAGKLQLDYEIEKAKDTLHLLEIQAAGMIHQVLGIEWVGQKAIEMQASPEGFFTRAYTQHTEAPKRPESCHT
eukprot:scaffold2156_cov115-Cylindrotheca_fusiformis.AAC.12